MTPEPIKGALILPDVGVRHDFADLIARELPGIDLIVSDALMPGEVPAELLNAEILFTFGHFLNDDILAHATSLRWIAGLGSGVDGLIDRPSLRSDVVVTNARGVHSVCVSEAALCLMLAMARGLPRLLRNQANQYWETGPARLLYGKTVGILGVGLIAEGLAERCKAFGMRLEGVSSRADAPGFDRIHPYEALAEAVAGFDYFVLLAPLSAATRNIVDRNVLQNMRADSFLINVARGGVVDEDALVACLADGGIAGAALDVFAVEPLPPTSPLWTLPNVLISPHAAGQHRDYASHVMPILAHNLHAFREGRTADLVNLVSGATAPANARSQG